MKNQILYTFLHHPYDQQTVRFEDDQITGFLNEIKEDNKWLVALKFEEDQDKQANQLANYFSLINPEWKNDFYKAFRENKPDIFLPKKSEYEQIIKDKLNITEVPKIFSDIFDTAEELLKAPKESNQANQDLSWLDQLSWGSTEDSYDSFEQPNEPIQNGGFTLFGQKVFDPSGIQTSMSSADSLALTLMTTFRDDNELALSEFIEIIDDKKDFINANKKLQAKNLEDLYGSLKHTIDAKELLQNTTKIFNIIRAEGLNEEINIIHFITKVIDDSTAKPLELNIRNKNLLEFFSEILDAEITDDQKLQLVYLFAHVADRLLDPFMGDMNPNSTFKN